MIICIVHLHKSLTVHIPASFDKVIRLLLTSPLNLSITPVLFACELHSYISDRPANSSKIITC